MPSKILIHTALSCEAQGIIEHYKLQKIEKNIFGNQNLLVVIGGVGSKTTQILTKIFHSNKFCKAINIGIAGTRNKNLPLGLLCCTNKKLDSIAYYPLQTIAKNTHQMDIDCLYDMEGKFFETTCTNYLLADNIFILKVISDYCDQEKLDKHDVKNLIKNSISKWNFLL